ncbi:MAG TPA: EamA family transporter [Longilinea sp.]|nr:EamA family transporter [Longilinea sp.]
MSTRDWIKFIALSLIWGTSFLWIKIAVTEVGPFILVVFRTLFAALTILVFLLYRRIKMPGTWSWWRRFIFVGFFNVALPFVLISWSEQYVSSGMASLMNCTMPLWTAILASIFLVDESFTWIKGAGLLVGFAGVILLISDQIGDQISGVEISLGMLCLAAISYAISSVFIRRKIQGIPPETQSLGQMGSAFLMILPVAAIADPPLRFPHLAITWLALLWLGILGSGVATILFYSLINSVGPTRASLTSYVYTFVAVLLGVIFLNEPLNWQLIVGGLMIIAGVMWVNYGTLWWQWLGTRLAQQDPS